MQIMRQVHVRDDLSSKSLYAPPLAVAKEGKALDKVLLQFT